MADKETGLNISVNAEANEASAAKAAKDLEKKLIILLRVAVLQYLLI